MAAPVAVFRLSGAADHSPLQFLADSAVPLQPDRLRLSLDLCRGIRHWSLFLEANFSFDGGWATAGDSNWYQREGSRLARAIAAELGEDFAIDLNADPDRDDLDEAMVRFRSDEEAERPQAAEAARSLGLAT